MDLSSPSDNTVSSSRALGSRGLTFVHDLEGLIVLFGISFNRFNAAALSLLSPIFSDTVLCFDAPAILLLSSIFFAAVLCLNAPAISLLSSDFLAAGLGGSVYILLKYRYT